MNKSDTETGFTYFFLHASISCEKGNRSAWHLAEPFMRVHSSDLPPVRRVQEHHCLRFCSLLFSSQFSDTQKTIKTITFPLPAYLRSLPCLKPYKPNKAWISDRF